MTTEAKSDEDTGCWLYGVDNNPNPPTWRVYCKEKGYEKDGYSEVPATIDNYPPATCPLCGSFVFIEEEFVEGMRKLLRTVKANGGGSWPPT